MEKNKQSGFTTLELTFVILIMGMVTSSFLYALQEYSRKQDREHTKEAIDTVQAALNEFKSIHGRYPCPARRNIALNNPLSGRENCIAATGVPGRDANRDGTWDQVLIGAIPFRTLIDPDNNPLTQDGIVDVPLTIDTVVDGWDRQLTYAVTRSMTNPNTYSEFNGAIDVVDENRRTVLQAPGTAHLVLISHGKNGHGAFTRDGVIVSRCENNRLQSELGQKSQEYAHLINNNGYSCVDQDCLSEQIDPADFSDEDRELFYQLQNSINGLQQSINSNEIQNCNNDATFLSGMYNESDDRSNDDFIRFTNTTTSGLWRYIDNERIVNSNPGNVGIGINNPTDRLEISGDLMAANVFAEQICDKGGQDCLTSDVLGGNAPLMQCPGRNQVVTSIENNRVNCVSAFSNSVGLRACQPGQFMTGVSSRTGVICIPVAAATPGGGYNWTGGGTQGTTATQNTRLGNVPGEIDGPTGPTITPPIDIDNGGGPYTPTTRTVPNKTEKTYAIEKKESLFKTLQDKEVE